MFDPVSELIIIAAECGKGKSSLAVHLADEYLKTQGIQRWELSEQVIRSLNAKRKKPLSSPNAPPMYTNVKGLKLTFNGNTFAPFYIKGKDVGISNDKEKYKCLFPAPLLLFDEAHSEFPSKGDKLPDGQQDFFNKRRHNRLIIILIAPRAVLIHKDIRNTGARLIEPQRLIHEYDAFGRICKTTWDCREFLDKSAIEEYISTDGKSGAFIRTTYEHYGNIRDLYDGFAFEDDFAPPEGEDYETQTN